jgi:ankyrin repeat protein
MDTDDDIWDFDLYIDLFEYWSVNYDEVTEENKDTIVTMLIDADVTPYIADVCLWGLAGAGCTPAILKIFTDTNRFESVFGDHTDFRDEILRDALCLACRHGRIDNIRYMFDYLFEHDEMEEIYPDFLEEASLACQKVAFYTLLALIDLKDMWYDTDVVLLHAATCGCEDVVTYMLASGTCDINKVHKETMYINGKCIIFQRTALAAASDPAMIKLLLDSKASVNPKNGVSVLAMAVRRFETDAVKMLLEAGVNVTKSSNKWTLMDICIYSYRRCATVSQNQIALINLLLKEGMMTWDLYDGSTALTLCATQADMPKWKPLMQALLAHDPALLNMPDEQGMTPLLASVECGPSQYQFTKFLLDVGANPTLCDHRGITALMKLWDFLPLSAEFRQVSTDAYCTMLIKWLLDAVRRRGHGSGGVETVNDANVKKQTRKRKRK